MSKNMKGIFKGLKYVTHIFDIEEEEEEEKIEIGLPTDVKHVAHIGWDGPAASSPSWMDDFKASPAPESASAPIQVDGLANDINRVAQDSTSKKNVKDIQSRDIQNSQKNSRRKSSTESTGSTESPHGSPTQKGRANNRRRQSKSKESTGESSNNPPNLPKKTRRKKSKDSDGSVKSKSKENGPRHGSRQGSGDGL